ncbi:MAG TPA: urease accessory protein UreD, partial [Candidatus Acidoferrum sp.]|nr:urease accessory protein UreD [Candidatus Acidoferrum sp.]
MVAGDCTRLDVTVDARARCFLGTQASTKIYRNPSRLPCSHELTATIGDDALLIFAPDPVQCFAESSYEQRQRFLLSATANLVLVDWMSAGRTACGERWSFHRYLSRNEIEREGKKLLVDALRLDASDGALNSQFRGGRFNCLATVVLFGPRLVSHAKCVLDRIAAQPITPQADLVFAGSPVHEGAIVRFAGISVEGVGHAIHECLGFVREIVEDDPWVRKW